MCAILYACSAPQSKVLGYCAVAQNKLGRSRQAFDLEKPDNHQYRRPSAQWEECEE